MSEEKQIQSENTNKPLVTFALFAYNQEEFVREAIESAFSQTYSPLEIILSDDASSDKTFEIMEEMAKDYNGSHVIKLNKNSNNLGIIGHVNLMFEISSGKLIVAAAGDDISLSERVECLVDAFNQSEKKALAIHSSAIKINNSNVELGIFIPPVIKHRMTPVKLARCNAIYIGATGAWNRSLYDEFGPVVFQDAYEDLVLGFRAAITNSLVYIEKPLVRYRVGVGVTKKVVLWGLKLPSGIKISKNKVKVMLDVYEQRLKDLDCVSQWDSDGVLKAELVRCINLQKKILSFYRNSSALLLWFKKFYR